MNAPASWPPVQQREWVDPVTGWEDTDNDEDDIFSDDTPLECGIENPEFCESCM